MKYIKSKYSSKINLPKKIKRREINAAKLIRAIETENSILFKSFDFFALYSATYFEVAEDIPKSQRIMNRETRAIK